MRPPRRGSIDAAFQLLPHAAAPGAPRFALEPAAGVLAAGAALVRPGRLCWPGCLPCSYAGAWPRHKAGEKNTTKQKNTRVAPQRSVGGGGGGGKRDPRAPQAVRARMVGDALGDFSQTFQWAVEGAAAPVRLEVRGRVVPPAVKVRCPRGVMASRARTWLSTRLKLPVVYTEHVPAWPCCSARDQATPWKQPTPAATTRSDLPAGRRVGARVRPGGVWVPPRVPVRAAQRERRAGPLRLARALRALRASRQHGRAAGAPPKPRSHRQVVAGASGAQARLLELCLAALCMLAAHQSQRYSWRASTAGRLPSLGEPECGARSSGCRMLRKSLVGAVRAVADEADALAERTAPAARPR